MDSHILRAINTQPGNSWFPFRRDISVRQEQHTSDDDREVCSTMRDMVAPSPGSTTNHRHDATATQQTHEDMEGVPTTISPSCE